MTGEGEALQRLFDLCPDLMCTLDETGSFEMANPSFRKLGYETKELRSHRFVDFLYQEDVTQMVSLLKATEADRAPREFEVRFRTKTGSFRVLAGSVVTDGNERTFVVARDETEARQTAQEVETVNRFLDAIVENIPNMVFVKEATHLSFVRFNREGEKLIGIKRQDLMGKTDRDLFPEEEAKFFQEKDRETLEGRVLVDIPEEPIATPSGQRWLHTKKVPILDDMQRPRFLLGISEDITDLRQAREELMQSREEARALNRELEAFSYSVAHDLRAPLRSLDGFSQALLEDYGEGFDEKGRKYLGYVRESAQHMGQLIDDILTLSRVSRSEMRRKKTNLSRLFETSIESLRQAEPERRVEVHVEKDLFAMVDPRLLGVVFDNLAGNAWKFSREREVAHIEFGEARDGDEQAFFVRDDGAGFDMAYTQKLFGVFQRLHSARRFEGTGVGLATVQRIVLRHGGRIWADAKVDGGATFFFTLTGRKASHE